jgi:hypothetical protein
MRMAAKPRFPGSLNGDNLMSKNMPKIQKQTTPFFRLERMPGSFSGAQIQKSLIYSPESMAIIKNNSQI